MGRRTRKRDEEEEAKKRHIQSLCDACCIRSLDPWIRSTLCHADDSFLEALVSTAQMPHEIESSDAEVYTEEIIKFWAQRSREDSTVQTQDLPRDQCTQKLQTTKKPDDAQKPQKSESTEVTVPSTESERERGYEYMKQYPYIQRLTFDQRGSRLWIVRKVFSGPRRFIALEADFLGKPIPESYQKEICVACIQHPQCGRIGDFSLTALDMSRDGKKLQVKCDWSRIPTYRKPLPVHPQRLTGTSSWSWIRGMEELKTEEILNFVAPNLGDDTPPTIHVLAMQLAAERALNPASPAADPEKAVTVTEKEIPQKTKHQVQRRKKFPILRNLIALGGCLLPMFWWQRYKKSRQL